MQIGICAVQRFSALTVLTGLFVLGALPAGAATISVELRSDGVLIDTLDENDLGAGCTAGGTAELCTLTNHVVGDYLVDLSLFVGTASGQTGFIGAGLTVDNTGLDVERLTVDLILTIGPFGAPSTESGGSVAPSVLDGVEGDESTPDGSVTLATVAGSSFYEALIDGTAFSRTLFDDPFAVNLGPSPPGQSFGLTVPSDPDEPGPGVPSTIRIRYDFTLTPLDQAGMTGKFVLQAVPEPGTAALLGLGLIGLTRIRRRR